jgi:hypothetical protein
MINVSLEKSSAYSAEFCLEFWFQKNIRKRKANLGNCFLYFEQFFLCFYH